MKSQGIAVTVLSVASLFLSLRLSDELKAINDEKFAMIHAYAQNWPSMSN